MLCRENASAGSYGCKSMLCGETKAAVLGVGSRRQYMTGEAQRILPNGLRELRLVSQPTSAIGYVTSPPHDIITSHSYPPAPGIPTL